MAFTVATRTSETLVANTSHSVTLPDGSNVVGRRVIVGFGAPTSAITWPAGWTDFFDGSTTDTRVGAAYRDIDGTEGFTGTLDSITVTTVESVLANAHSYLIDGHDAATAPEAATAATGIGANADAPSLNPAGWDVEEALWIAVAGYRFGASFSAAPANYTGLLSLNGGDDNTPLGSARRVLSAASEDPGAFTSSDGANWVATTIAVRPGAATGTTGSLAETQDDQTLSASGTLGHSGSLAETQAGQTLSASGTLGLTGSLAETQADQSLSASGTLGLSGSLAETQADQTLNASGTVTGAGATGSLSETQDDQTATIVGWVEATGTVAQTQDDQTLSATGTTVHTGTLAVTQADHTLSASGSTFVPTADPNPAKLSFTEPGGITYRETFAISYQEPA